MLKRSLNFFITLIVLLTSSPWSGASVNIAVSSKNEEIALSLKQAWELVQSNNEDIKIMKIRYDLEKSGIERSLFNLYYPNVNFQANYGTGKSVYQIPGSNEAQNGSSSQKVAVPRLGMGITLSSYNLYNSGLDALQLRSINMNKEASELNFRNSMNDKRKSVIETYFNIVNQVKTEEAIRKNIVFLEAILGLIKIKSKLKKLPPDSISRAEIDLNNAKQTLQNEEINSKNMFSQLNTLLEFEQDQKLRLTTDVPVVSLKLKPEQIEERYKSSNSALKMASFNLERSRMDLERVYLDMFPLKVTLSGGAWNTDVNKNEHTSSIVSGNVDVNMAISVTVPIVSDRGVFGMKDRADKMTNLKLTEDSYNRDYKRGIADFKFFLNSLKVSEEAIEQERKNFEKISEFLNSKIENFATESSTLLEMRELLESVKNQELAYNKKVLERFGQIHNLYLQLDLDIMDEIPQ